MHLGIIGHGNIATTLIGLLEPEPIERITVLVRPRKLHDAKVLLAGSRAALGLDAVSEAEAMVAKRPDLVIECAAQEAAAAFLPPLLRAGIPAVLASVGALADPETEDLLLSAARAGHTRLTLPSGAIGGIDLLAAIAPAGGLEVTYRGRKPPAAWKCTPAEDAVDLDAVKTAETFFTGTAREAARAYPKNANVAATLALAGAGLDATRVELVADPAAPGNVHAYEVRSPLCRYSMEIENMASGSNARTSVTTVYSLLREVNRLRRCVAI